MQWAVTESTHLKTAFLAAISGRGNQEARKCKIPSRAPEIV